MSTQVFDSMDIEKERGITIKAQTAALNYKARDGQVYQLQSGLTRRDTSISLTKSLRSLSASRKARCWSLTHRKAWKRKTVANCYTTIDLGVEVVPVLNKIDLPAADPERVGRKSKTSSALTLSERCNVPPKAELAWKTFLEEIVAKKIPAPTGGENAAAASGYR